MAHAVALRGADGEGALSVLYCVDTVLIYPGNGLVNGLWIPVKQKWQISTVPVGGLRAMETTM